MDALANGLNYMLKEERVFVMRNNGKMDLVHSVVGLLSIQLSLWRSS